MKILVTGGCGFIGSHLVDELVKKGHRVRVIDLLEPQVHLSKPSYLNKDVEYIFEDIRNKDKLKKALRGIEVIFHQASQVGVGQSMYEVERYISHNCSGTAVLLDLIINTKNKVQKIIVASSMSIYGEGAYRCEKCGNVYPRIRNNKQLKMRDWELRCIYCKNRLTPIPASEEKPLFPTSIYAITKKTQEEMCLEIGRAYKIPTVSLRYFNVYGPRQSLSNPYTGVIAIFLSRIKNDKPPLIYEDGKQSRDFIYVLDIVQANILAMEKKQADYDFFNVGTGRKYTILDVAKTISYLYNKEELSPKILNRFRAGDIRHCFADIKKIYEKLGFKPKFSLEEGIKKLIEWADNEKALDFTDKANLELKKRRLIE